MKVGNPHSDDGRFNPNAAWIRMAWDPRNDPPYTKARKENDRAIAATITGDPKDEWIRRAMASYDEWFNDHQDPLKLYRACDDFGLAGRVNPRFRENRLYRQMLSILYAGWSCLDKYPKSYEFARRGYVFNSGHTGQHVYHDLPYRLLAKSPIDRPVILAMVWDYENDSSRDAKFEKFMFEKLERLSQTKQWQARDSYAYGVAHGVYGIRHKSKPHLQQAIAKVEFAIKSNLPGFNIDHMHKYLKRLKNAMAATW